VSRYIQNVSGIERDNKWILSSSLYPNLTDSIFVKWRGSIYPQKSEKEENVTKNLRLIWQWKGGDIKSQAEDWI
jgi:hypothetical protein